MTRDEGDGIDCKVGYWANFHRVPTVHIDTSGWTEKQRASFLAELERQNEDVRLRALRVLDAAIDKDSR